MSRDPRTPQAVLSRARRRRVRDVLLTLLPPVLALSAAVWWLADLPWAATVLGLALGALAVWTQKVLKPLDRRWLVQRLDAAQPTLEDSSDLLLAAPGTLTGLALLQAERVSARLVALPPAQLKPAWPRHAVMAGSAVALLVLSGAAGVWWWRQQSPPSAPPAVVAGAGAPTPVGPTRLSAVQLEIQPPDYTGLRPSRGDQLEVRAPVGSVLRWSLAFDPVPRSARLEFHDGESLPLAPSAEGARWEAFLPALERSRLYRIVLDASAAPLADAGLKKLEVRPDRPPQIQVVLPDRALTLLEAGQKAWALELEISDDYGLGAATLDLTLAQGSGENQTVQQRRMELSPQPGSSATQRRYTPQLDLAALGMAAGDDLIVRVEALDRRAPQPQRARSSSLILRWPAELMEESGGMDGLVKKVLPAYFRSQRQIIIDTEALLAEQPQLTQEQFVIRSDTIGVDQRLLRLRYGQFLGEVVEGGPEAPGGGHAHEEDADAHAEDTAGATGAAHEHGEETGAADGFGALAGGSALEAFGHTHDIPEAATLLDPQTREILRSALQEMWQAELHLRTAEPRQALPYERRALEYIKQVQQASRIYLARVGLELPPIDLGRRLSGDRSKVRPGRDPLANRSAAASPVAEAWSTVDAATGAPALAAVTAWAQARLEQLAAGAPEEAALLGLLAAADAVTRDPDCRDCRHALKAQLWPLLPRIEAAGASRERVDAVGAAWLDALESAP